MKQILIYGYGNPGRGDDAAGPLMVELLEQQPVSLDNAILHLKSTFQLNVEDAELITHYDSVYFIDSTIENSVDDFSIEDVTEKKDPGFTSHTVSPEFVVELSKLLFQWKSKAKIVKIKGYDWDISERMSSRAFANLCMAKNTLIDILQQEVKIFTIKN